MFIALSNKKSILTFALEIKSLIEAVRSNPSTMPFESCSKRFVTDLVKLNVFLLIKRVEIKGNLKKKFLGSEIW